LLTKASAAGNLTSGKEQTVTSTQEGGEPCRGNDPRSWVVLTASVFR